MYIFTITVLEILTIAMASLRMPVGRPVFCLVLDKNILIYLMVHFEFEWIKEIKLLMNYFVLREEFDLL